MHLMKHVTKNTIIPTKTLVIKDLLEWNGDQYIQDDLLDF